MSNKEFNPPIQGIHKGLPADKSVLNTSEYMANVRAIGLNGRILIAQRPGLSKWSTNQIGAAEQPIVSMVTVSSVV